MNDATLASPLALVSLSGALGALYGVIGLFFLRFRARSGDRLFSFFAAAFFLLAAQRFALTAAREWGEHTTWLYAIRLLAFSLILWAIIDKNRAAAGTAR